MIKFNYSHGLGDFHVNAAGEFPLNKITALFGDSGCGKSTLLRLIAGIEGEYPGNLMIGNELIQDPTQSLAAWQRNLGYVSQQCSLFPHLNVEQNLIYAEQRRQSKRYEWTREQLINLFGIEELLQRKTFELSGGQQQRVAITRALLRHPICLLLDEPVSALDEKSRFDVLMRLQELSVNDHLTILYVSHDRREVAQLADYIMIMKKGKIVSQGDYLSVATDLDLPFVHSKDAISILPVIVGNESSDHLTELFYGEQTLWIRASGIIVGSSMRLQITANEISLSLQYHQNTSVLNQLKVTVVALNKEHSGQQLISVATSEHILLARITSRSVERLNLQVGTECFASFKAVAIHQ